MKPSKLQHRVTRTRVKVSKLLELGVFYCALWIRRVLVRAQEGQLQAPHRISDVGAFCLGCSVQSWGGVLRIGYPHATERFIAASRLAAGTCGCPIVDSEKVIRQTAATDGLPTTRAHSLPSRANLPRTALGGQPTPTRFPVGRPGSWPSKRALSRPTP